MRRRPTPEKLEWKGSHLGATVSPDGRFLVTTMQEPMLHGWRLVDRKHMRMSGYAARVTSFGWTVGGRWLATSGATQLILWPFQTKDGPMGKQPRLLAPSEHRVEAVACHPRQDIVATGYGDGMVLLIRIDDGAEILAKKPGDAPVKALAWSADGLFLAWGAENGEAGVVDLTLIRAELRQAITVIRCVNTIVKIAFLLSSSISHGMRSSRCGAGPIRRSRPTARRGHARMALTPPIRP